MENKAPHWVEHYRTHGYHFPKRIMSTDQALELRQRLEAAEAAVAADPVKRKLLASHPTQTLPFFDELARSPEVVEPVKALLGDDVLIWNATLFAKEAHSQSYISWHQDLTYWGLSEAHEVTAWIALSEVSTANGCMKFIPGSHTQDIVPHVDTFDANNLLSRGQEIAVDVDEDEAVHVELAAGEMSLHHGKLFHGSSVNRTAQRRIGLAIRYIPTSLKQTIDEKPFARLACGTDRFGHYRLLDPPRGVLDDADVATLQEHIRIQEQFLFAGAEGARSRR